jgi:hypothetical protein
MRIGVFMGSLERQGVTFDLVEGVLQVSGPLGMLSELQQHELVARRAEIEYLVRLALTPAQAAEERVVADDRHTRIALGHVA